MEDDNSKKVNKSPKLTKEIVAIIIAFLLIGVYVFYECFVVTNVEVETITAVTSTVYETINTQALVIRDEQIIDDNSSAVNVSCVADGEKVKVGGNIAYSFSSSENARKYSQLNSLHSELDYYLDLQSKSAGIATDVESIDKDILSDVNSYIRAAEYAQSELDNYAQDLNDKFTRRQMIIGENIDFSKIIANLESEISSIDTAACEPTGYVKTDRSGVFSSFTDGCEKLFDYNDVKNLDVKTLDDYISRVSNAQKKDCLGKLITNYEWYFCCKVDAYQIKNIENDDKLQVALKNSDMVIDCEVLSGASVDLGVKETVLVLRSSQMDGAISSMRLEDIEIRYNDYTGFKIPSSAIHVDDEGNKGVYALIANQVIFRQGNIIYSTKDYAIFEYKTDGDESIRLYDQIITRGKDLQDGKVYT